MNIVDVVRHRVAVAGHVTDAGTGKAISQAVVTITAAPEAFERRLQLASLQYGDQWDAMPERPDKTRTRDDGLFYFLDLPDGNYSLTASLPGSYKRYGSVQQTAKVSRDAKGDTRIAFVNLSLQATAVKGKITGANHKTGVVMAQVRVKGSGERVFSDAQGDYVISAIEPGKRTISVSAQGYRQVSQLVVVREPGTSETLNFKLVRDNE